jgi:hypothetical protein
MKKETLPSKKRENFSAELKKTEEESKKYELPHRFPNYIKGQKKQNKNNHRTRRQRVEENCAQQ